MGWITFKHAKVNRSENRREGSLILKTAVNYLPVPHTGQDKTSSFEKVAELFHKFVIFMFDLKTGHLVPEFQSK